MIEILSLASFLLISFSIGSNDTSNAFGICVGCRIISIRRASFLLFVFVLLGILLQGERVVKTVGQDLVEVSDLISAFAMIISALMIVVTNFRGFPVSTHQIIVGSLLGAGFAFGTSFNPKTLSEIILSWFFSPLMAGFIAIAIFLFTERLFRRYTVLQIERGLRYLMFCSAIVVAYNMGANELATAIAPIAGNDRDYYLKAVLGATLISAGAYTLSKRIAETLCRGITNIDPKTGFSAHFGAGITVYLFTIIGMPVSTTYSLFGGILAIGFFKGLKTINLSTLKNITLSWILAPIFAFILSFIVSKIYLLT